MLSRTIWRKKWFLVVLVLCIPMPFAILAWAWSLPITDHDIDLYLEEVARAQEATFGPSIAADHEKIFGVRGSPSREQYPEPWFMHDILALQAGVNASGVMDAPSARPELKWVDDYAGSWFADVDRLAAKGVAWRKSAIDMVVPDFLRIQQSVKVRTARAVGAAGSGDWDSALGEAQAAAVMADSVRGCGLIGNLIDIACRSVAYGCFRRLLDEQPGADADREAARRLGELRASEPDAYPVLLAAESAAFLDWARNPKRAPIPGEARRDPLNRFYSNLMMLRGAEWKVQQAAHQMDPARHFQNLPKLNDRLQFIPWTRFPAARAHVERFAREHPEAFSNSAMPNASAASDALPLDRRLYLSAEPMFQANVLEWLTRTRVMKTNGALLQAAYASRVFRDEQDRWPQADADLDPGLFNPVPEDSADSIIYDTDPYFRPDLSRPQLPFGPFSFGTVVMDEDRLNRLITALMHRAGFGSFGILSMTNVGDPKNGLVECAIVTNQGDVEPLFYLYLGESLLRMKSKLVRKVEYFDSQGRSITSEELREAGYARAAWEIREEQRTPRVGAPTLPASLPTHYGAAPAERPRLAVGSMRLVLAPPKEVFEIRSPGPDGRDDAGLPIYDSTNGTISSGDIVIYPGGW